MKYVLNYLVREPNFDQTTLFKPASVTKVNQNSQFLLFYLFIY